MDKEIEKVLERVDQKLLRTIPDELAKCLTGKGLTFRQAEAMLDYTKDLLKNVKI